LALAITVFGLVVALRPFDAAITIPNPNGIALQGSSHCGVPVRAAFSPSSDNRVWFAYAPGTAVYASDGFSCQAPAQRRAAFGGAAILLGIALAVISLRSRSTRPTEASVP
jgi:hypothetical protein